MALDNYQLTGLYDEFKLFTCRHIFTSILLDKDLHKHIPLESVKRGGPMGSPHSPGGTRALQHLRKELFPIPHTTRRNNYRTKRRKKRLEERQRQALAWALKHEGIDYTNAYGVDDPVPLLAMRNIVAEGRRLG